MSKERAPNRIQRQEEQGAHHDRKIKTKRLYELNVFLANGKQVSL